MLINPCDLDRPIRFVVFSSGPVLEQDVRQFILRLADHDEIVLLAVICQSNAQGSGASYRTCGGAGIFWPCHCLCAKVCSA